MVTTKEYLNNAKTDSIYGKEFYKGLIEQKPSEIPNASVGVVAASSISVAETVKERDARNDTAEAEAKKGIGKLECPECGSTDVALNSAYNGDATHEKAIYACNECDEAASLKKFQDAANVTDDDGNDSDKEEAEPKSKAKKECKCVPEKKKACNCKEEKPAAKKSAPASKLVDLRGNPVTPERKLKQLRDTAYKLRKRIYEGAAGKEKKELKAKIAELEVEITTVKGMMK